MNANTAAGCLKEAAKRSPNAPFLIEGGQKITYSQFDHYTDRLATAFLQKGFSPGDKIGIAALNQSEWLFTFFAAAKIGAETVALSPRFRESEFEYMCNHSDLRAIVSIAALPDFDFSEFFSSLSSRLPKVDTYIFIGEGFRGSYSLADLMETEADEEQLSHSLKNIREEDNILMIYTSGTTGNPKGTMITNQSITASARAQVRHFGMKSHDVAIGSLPFNHVGGITCTIMAALLSQSSVALVPSFRPDTVLEVIQSEKATIFGGVPTMYLMMLTFKEHASYDLSSLRLCIAGGSNVEPELCDMIRDRIPQAQMANLYGLSETSGACVLSNITDSPEQLKKSIGVAIGDFEVKVVGDDEREVARGEIGELVIRGDCVAKGYYKNESETARSFQRGGWLFTGDMVSMDEEDRISFKGRKKEMYVSGGYNIFPGEVENVLVSHPKVQMAAGIGVPDELFGESGVYFIVPSGEDAPMESELEAHCRKYLADYKIPKSFVVTRDVPLTPAGKIQKVKLKEKLEEQYNI
ncbi:class I adenylate-forming enzyme family protein [Alteribacter natronophilus]|uniref:class I adenylate-forming enzyme family protein n=1 Tax=Alteribacter natronophilus TaxID=2583810 RepID=UPI00110E4ECB|nr:class I adenylate-forming enzyme family protein [Alteribacter natronophilus]TMW71577.1 acyl--CoA ligase [Alteribacter natronophilus]